MEQIPAAEAERTMKVQEVILRAMAMKISWWQAAEILGISERTRRRWKFGYAKHGFRALYDKRKGKPSWKKAPAAEVEQVLGLYRDRYYDLNVVHFLEKLAEEHGIRWSYSWVKNVLQEAGLVNKIRSRRKHRKRRPRKSLPGMMLHIDGSQLAVSSDLKNRRTATAKKTFDKFYTSIIVEISKRFYGEFKETTGRSGHAVRRHARGNGN